MGKRKATTGGTQHVVARLGNVMLDRVLALTETQQRLVLFVVCMYQQGARLDNRVVCRVPDIHQLVGGNKDEIYRTLRDHAIAIKKGTVYYGPEDPKTGNSIISSLFGDIVIDPGEGEFIVNLSPSFVYILNKVQSCMDHTANIKLSDGLMWPSLRDRIIAEVSEATLARDRSEAEVRSAAPSDPGCPDRGQVESLAALAVDGGPHHAEYLSWIEGQGDFARDMAAKEPGKWTRYWAEDALRSGRIGEAVDVTAEPVPPPPGPTLADVPDERLERIAARNQLLGLPVGSSAAQVRARVAELDAKGHETSRTLLMSLLIMDTPDDEPPEPMVKGRDYIEVDYLAGPPRRRGRPRKADR